MSDGDYQAGWDAGFHKGLTATEGFTGHDMAQAREEGYSAGVQRAVECERILTELIADLKGHPDVAVQRATYKLLYRAETRLREVQGE